MTERTAAQMQENLHPPRTFRERRVALACGLKVVAGAAFVAVADMIFRRYLPGSMLALLPILVFAAGVISARCLAGPEQVEMSAGDAAEVGISSAVAELERLPADCKQPGRPDPISHVKIPADESVVNTASATDHEQPVQPDDLASDPDINIIAFPIAVRSDAAVQRAVTELEQYRTFTDISSTQMNCVVELTEDAAKDILTNLANVDVQIRALLAFIQQSGSNEQAVKVVAQIESQIKSCQDLLGRFAHDQGADALDSRNQRSRLVAETKVTAQEALGASCRTDRID